MLRRSLVVAALVSACSHAASVPRIPPAATPEAGKHHDDVEAQVKPYVDAELVNGLVIGLYDAGKLEVYGFGHGPHGAPPDGSTLFELGPVTKVYTSLLLADAVQRREVGLETPLADVLPPGVTAPTRDKVAITLRHLALHASGLPRLPPSLAGHLTDPDPYKSYGEDALYRDLIRTELVSVPGTLISYSAYGSGLLGFALTRKLGAPYAKLVGDRLLRPLELHDTFVVVPPALQARRAIGTNDDLVATSPWTYDVLAGAGAVVSSAADQLKLIDAELDAAAGGTTLALRRAMKLTQDAELDRTGDNEGLGWNIDAAGRYWINGGTGGFHAFVGFDPKTKHGVVVLSSTATSLVDRLADAMYKVLDAAAPAPVKFPVADQLGALVGHYDLSGTKIAIVAAGKRLYLESPGEPRHRLSPLSDHEMWIEVLQSVAVFEKAGDKVDRVVFSIGDHALAATRVDN